MHAWELSVQIWNGLENTRSRDCALSIFEVSSALRWYCAVVVWCGVLWYVVLWCGVLLWCDVVWCAVVCCGVVYMCCGVVC